MRYKLGDRVRIIASPLDPFNESLAEMAGDVGVVAIVQVENGIMIPGGYEVHFNDGLMRVQIQESDLQPEDAPYRERWDTALETLSIIRTVITDPGSGYVMPTPEVAADAIDYAIGEIMSAVDPVALERAGYE